jgi:Uma2 family endonuclease
LDVAVGDSVMREHGLTTSETTVKKRIEISEPCADRLRLLAQDHRMSEDQIIEDALNILFSLFDNLDPQAQQRGWLILPEKLLSTMHRNTDGSLLRQGTMSYEEFLEWADEDMLTEWVDGEVIIASPSSDRDRVIREFLHNVMRIFVGVKNQGIVRTARFQMKLKRSGREPDLFFVATEHLDRLKPTFLDGPADMVVEIASSESIYRDRGEKFYEYEQAGIAEYILIDPMRQWVETYSLGSHGHYQTVFNGETGGFHSTVIKGFWLRAEWLWSPPPILQALREMGLISQDAQYNGKV